VAWRGGSSRSSRLAVRSGGRGVSDLRLLRARVRTLENTAAIRGMIDKVRHMVRVPVEIRDLSSRRFNALGGYPPVLLVSAAATALGCARVISVVARRNSSSEVATTIRHAAFTGRGRTNLTS
jgi:hypothetical protein